MNIDRKPESPAAVVEFIFAARKEEWSTDAITSRLLEDGYSESDIDYVNQMIEFAANRVALLATGALFISADYDDCPYFQAALTRISPILPSHMATRGFRLTIWITGIVASLIGLAAIGAVIYYIIDWWRATH